MDLYKHERTKYDVPLSHLDFSYIDKCKEVKELEKILKILRSGCEGHYPELEELTEKKLEALNPNSKVLRKEKPALLKNYMEKTEQEQIDAELKSWENEIRSQENSVLETVQQTDDQSLPPVRGSGSNIPLSQKVAEEQARKQRKLKPRDYKEWDKVDIEAELAKVDGEVSKPNKNVLRSKTDLPDKIDVTDLSEPEKVVKANREKDKGNEAFRAGDYSEALLYYKRSISVMPTAAGFNNRAQTYLKMSKWIEAYKDCNTVLEMEPDNIKALLRRAMASKGRHDYLQAKNDLITLMHHEPGNKKAKQLLVEVENSLADQKVKGRRMVIEEVQGSDDSSSGDDEEESKQINPKLAEMTNGQSEHQKSHQAQNESKSEVGKIQPNSKDIWAEEELVTPNGNAGTSRERCPDSQKLLPNDQTNQECSAKQRDIEKVEKKSTASKVTDVKADGTQKSSSATSKKVAPSELPDNIKQMKNEGNNLFRCGQYPEAVQMYNKCIEKLLHEKGSHSYNLSLLYCNRAGALQKMGDCRSSVSDCNSALKLEPTNVKALARRAKAYEDMEKYREAYVDYRQILLCDSSVDIAQQGSTRCSQVLIQEDGAKWREKLPVVTPIVAPSISMLENYTERDTGNAAGESTDLKLEEKLPVSTEKLFEKHKIDGNGFVKKGDYNSAIPCYTKCIEYCPDNGVAYTNRALCYLKMKQFSEVITDCDQALSIQNDNIKALFRRALAYKELQQYENSVKDFKHILKIDAKNTAARKEFAIVLREKQKFETQAPSVKHRQRVHIEEVESSESDSDDVRVKGAMCNREREQRKCSPTKTGLRSNVETDRRVSEKEKQTSRKKDVLSSEKIVPPKKSIPVLARISPYEFMQAWISVKLQNDIKSYTSLLSQVPPHQLKKVITNKLDGHMLSTLIKCVGNLAEQGDTNKAYEYLSKIPEVSRFGVVSMFMSDGDKKDVSVLLNLFKTSLKDQITDEQIVNIKKQYQL